MKTYNGHRSWNAWNVSLWINNTESIYFFSVECCKEAKTLGGAVRRFMRYYEGEKTPDGAVYNPLAVKLAIEETFESYN